jgi:hypothetical protein
MSLSPPTRLSPGEVLQQIAAAYRLPVDAVLDRSHRDTYQTAVYLLRRAANEPLRTIAISNLSFAYLENSEGDRSRTTFPSAGSGLHKVQRQELTPVFPGDSIHAVRLSHVERRLKKTTPWPLTEYCSRSLSLRCAGLRFRQNAPTVRSIRA